MSSTNFVATPGKHHEHSSAEQQAGMYRTNVNEAEKGTENFVRVSAPPELEAYPADEKSFGYLTQGKKTLAKAPVF
ncbi:MAG: hypothetical protein SH868_03280 [Bythopirellula sp.]|nr:hypothetical protein [Bythopirellula sp.]